MFKKLTLIFACALSAVIVLTGCSEESSSGSSSSSSSSSKASAKIDQSSKEALLKSVATAIMNKDADTLWNLLSPDCQQQGITEYGSKEKTLEALKKLCDDPEVQKKVKETLSDKQKFAERMDNASNDMVQIDGKWYVDEPF
jgi:hypothetical protein